VTRFALRTVAITASFGLAAGLAAQEKPRPDYAPFEVQIGASVCGYDSRQSLGSSGRIAEFAPKGAAVAPSLKISVDLLPFKIGKLDASVLISGGWRLANDVPLEVDFGLGASDASSDLRHKSQISLGAALKVNLSKRFDVALGIDERQDWMYADGIVGSDSEETVWRPWLRAQARYLFDRGTRITPFVGIEAAFAMAAAEVDASNHYHDFAINTGCYMLPEFAAMGPVSLSTPSPESFTKGHMPLWEVALVGGARFGRHCR